MAKRCEGERQIVERTQNKIDKSKFRRNTTEMRRAAVMCHKDEEEMKRKKKKKTASKQTKQARKI